MQVYMIEVSDDLTLEVLLRGLWRWLVGWLVSSLPALAFPAIIPSYVHLGNSKRILKLEFGDLRKWPAQTTSLFMYNLEYLRFMALNITVVYYRKGVRPEFPL